MSHPGHTGLLAALAQERVEVRGLVEILRQEQTLLIENNTDPLLQLAEKKSAIALRLNELTEARRELQSKFIPTLDLPAVRNWYTANSMEGLALWSEMRELADQAQNLNTINGELIQMKLRHNQQFLGALSRAVSQASLYGPDGQTNFSKGSGRSLGNG